MEISKMLTLSTGHVSKRTLGFLEEEATSPCSDLSVYPKGENCEFGMFIYINNADIEAARSVLENVVFWFPTDLARCILFAAEMGCDVLCFDCDAAPLPFLQWHEDKDGE